MSDIQAMEMRMHDLLQQVSKLDLVVSWINDLIDAIPLSGQDSQQPP